MNKCILKNIELNKQNNSKYHTIPNALGGRLKPENILCHEANEILNEKFDNSLVKSFSPIMSLTGGTRDRCNKQLTTIVTDSGDLYRVLHE